MYKKVDIYPIHQKYMIRSPMDFGILPKTNRYVNVDDDSDSENKKNENLNQINDFVTLSNRMNIEDQSIRNDDEMTEGSQKEKEKDNNEDMIRTYKKEYITEEKFKKLFMQYIRERDPNFPQNGELINFFQK